MDPQDCDETSIQQKPLSLSFSKLTSFCNEGLNKLERDHVVNVLQQGFGPGGLGVIVVRDVPCYARARQELLPLASRFSSLDDSVKEACQDAESSFQIGWSHGIEKLQNGQVDTFKGSYYANPVSNTPTKDVDVIKSYPVYARPNVWPTKDLPELEQAFMTLGQIIAKVGILLAKACDLYLATKGVPSKMEDVLERSMCTKGRLLHYFPTAGSSESAKQWCGTHCDHGTLTGLSAAMYLDDSHSPVRSPDARAGLHVVGPGGEEVKVHIPEDAIGFQLGQAAQIMSDGLFRATPHFVKAPTRGGRHSRNTFACFLQPNWDEPMKTKVDPTSFGIHPAQWQKGCNFGEFAANTVKWFFADLSEQSAGRSRNLKEVGTLFASQDTSVAISTAFQLICILRWLHQYGIEHYCQAVTVFLLYTFIVTQSLGSIEALLLLGMDQSFASHLWFYACRSSVSAIPVHQ